MCGHCGCGEPDVDHDHDQTRFVKMEQDVLAENNRYAEENRRVFAERHILALNLVSSPGSGKTTLLTQTLNRLKGRISTSVIVGDQQTDRDARRLTETGTPVQLLNTGKGCHLDAHRVGHCAECLDKLNNGILFIENVGNLVCPAMFDLGEKARVVVLSVTEGDDKPLKYPDMFATSQLMIINKTDLLPYVDFDVEQCIEYARRVSPGIEILQLSATQGDGLDAWLNWLDTKQHPRPAKQ